MMSLVLVKGLILGAIQAGLPLLSILTLACYCSGR